MSQIWILEDDPGSQFIYEEILGTTHKLLQFPTIKEFKRSLKDKKIESPDLVIADLSLPDENFLSFLASSEEEILNVPFMVVSSRDDLGALKVCFEEGALDYLTKPFKKAELIIKVERILTKKNIQVDIQKMSVSQSDSKRSVVLTVKELQILNLLQNSPEQKLTKGHLFKEIWKDGRSPTRSKTLDVHLFNLRKKIKPLGLQIVFSEPDELILVKVAVSSRNLKSKALNGE